MLTGGLIIIFRTLHLSNELSQPQLDMSDISSNQSTVEHDGDYQMSEASSNHDSSSQDLIESQSFVVNPLHHRSITSTAHNPVTITQSAYDETQAPNPAYYELIPVEGIISNCDQPSHVTTCISTQPNGTLRPIHQTHSTTQIIYSQSPSVRKDSCTGIQQIVMPAQMALQNSLKPIPRLMPSHRLSSHPRQSNLA